MLDASSRARSAKFSEVLNASRIDLDALRTLTAQGIPDESHQRALCWRILLHYLHPNRSYWAEHLEKQRLTYRHYVDDILVNPTKSQSNDNVDDHPLSTNPTSAWSAFFKDNQVLQQINKDVRRLCPEISFFQQPTCAPHPLLSHDPLCKRVARSMLESEIISKDSYTGATKLARKLASEEYKLLPPGQEAHWQVVERILFVYSKLNPGVGYVQGMNELLGPIYYVFAVDNNKEWKENAEADTFFCFQNLMAELKDNFIKNLDDSNCGIDALMTRFYALFETRDLVLYKCLVEEQSLLPQYYAFRWLSLMLSQEFLLPDVIRIWDSLFADSNRFEMLQFVCLAMLIHVREELLSNDFTHNLKLLQNYPPTTDVGDLLRLASDLQSNGLVVK